MCNINIIMRKDSKNDSKVNELMNIMSLSSFVNNSDGEGYLMRVNKDYFIDKSLNKINYSNMKDSNLLITHQRLSTSGFTSDNTHPHESDNFILKHNGVFSGLGNKEKSDSRFYLDLLEKNYKKLNNLVESIRETNKSVSGTYSVVLFDKKTKRIFYYKNISTQMHILQDRKYLIMSTSNKNVEMAKIFLSIKSKIHEVNHNIIYELTSKGLKYINRFEPFSYYKEESKKDSKEKNMYLRDYFVDYSNNDTSDIKEYDDLYINQLESDYKDLISDIKKGRYN